jgi:hypothetical protein
MHASCTYPRGKAWRKASMKVRRKKGLVVAACGHRWGGDPCHRPARSLAPPRHRRSAHRRPPPRPANKPFIILCFNYIIFNYFFFV